MSNPAKTHGLDGTLVEPDWPPITTSEVRRVLAEYSESVEPCTIVSTSPRPFSAASVIATPQRKVFLKRHANVVRNVAALREEHCFITHLRGHGIAVPEVLVTKCGDTVVEMDSSTFELHSIPHGVDLYRDALSWTPFFSTEHARSAGQTLARLHNAAVSFCAPSRTERALVASFSIFAANDPSAAWEVYVGQRPALKCYVESHGLRDRALDLFSPFHRDLLPLLPHLHPLWTHNDLHGSNLFWSDATPAAHATAVIDFGLCDRTNAVHDLAQALERSIVHWLALMRSSGPDKTVSVDTAAMWALLEGYNAVRPLAAAERAALAPMLALCHAEFALSEADYFLTALHSEEKARVACEDYLIGHAEWWRGQGTPLLDSIRAWAAGRGDETGAPVP